MKDNENIQKNPRLILASASPRRLQLLGEAGFSFSVAPADVDESRHEAEDPALYVQRLAQEKALAITHRHPSSENIYVLGADTAVVLGPEVFGKPADEAEAFDFLKRLTGKTHEVLTGFALARAPDQILFAKVISSKVTMKPRTDEEIRTYIRTGEPMDKAGAYAAQGKGRELILKIDGSLNNVIGLPVEELSVLLEEKGLDFRTKEPKGSPSR